MSKQDTILVKGGKSRIVYLDLVKLFTIYLVIMGHDIARMVNGYTVGGRMYALIYSFHMPLFMMLSGYFISSKTLSKAFPDFLLTKARQLLLPVVTCTVICLLYLFLAREHVDVRSEIIGNSWFLKTLFVFYVLFYLIKKIPMNDWVLLIVSCGLLFVIPHATTLQVNLLFPYFWGGVSFKEIPSFGEGILQMEICSFLCCRICWLLFPSTVFGRSKLYWHQHRQSAKSMAFYFTKVRGSLFGVSGHHHAVISSIQLLQ